MCIAWWGPRESGARVGSPARWLRSLARGLSESTVLTRPQATIDRILRTFDPRRGFIFARVFNSINRPPLFQLATDRTTFQVLHLCLLSCAFPIDAQVSITFPHRHFSPSIPLSSALVNRSRILLPFQGYWDTITKDRNLGGKRTRGFTLSLLGKLAFTLEKSCFWLEASQLREIEDFFKIIFFNLGLGFFL